MCKATAETRDLIAKGFAANDQKNTELFQGLRKTILLQDKVMEDFKKETRDRLEKMENNMSELIAQEKQGASALLQVAKNINELAKELHGRR